MARRTAAVRSEDLESAETTQVRQDPFHEYAVMLPGNKLQCSGYRSRQAKLFKELEIYKNRAFGDEFMGRYPVISLSFKDVEGDNYQDR